MKRETRSADLLPGTLDMLILKAVSLRGNGRWTRLRARQRQRCSASYEII
jgi:hypothetical protein